MQTREAACQVVSEAHAVILASGTLAPVSAVTRQLFPGPDAAVRLRRFSCGHVVARERLLTLAVGALASNKSMPFQAHFIGSGIGPVVRSRFHQPEPCIMQSSSCCAT